MRESFLNSKKMYGVLFAVALLGCLAWIADATLHGFDMTATLGFSACFGGGWIAFGRMRKAS